MKGKRMNNRLFTSESVTEGHPDKICDQISDAILDEVMKRDPNGRVACETAITTGLVLVMGEISANTNLEIPQIVKNVISDIGYTKEEFGFNVENCEIIVALDEQSTDIAMGVDKAYETKISESEKSTGAGDQGMMFGYATDETEEYMPYSAVLAHKLAYQLTKVRKNGTLAYLRPDGKTQVTVEYDQEGNPFRIDTVVLSTQHSQDVNQKQIKEDIKNMSLIK